MASTEQWTSRDIEFGYAGDGTRVSSETRRYNVDEADILTWEPPDGKAIRTWHNVVIQLAHISLKRHEKGTKAVIEVTYSNKGKGDDGSGGQKPEWFFRPATTMKRVSRTCRALQHPNVAEIPYPQMILGRVTWEGKAPVDDLDLVGTVNAKEHGPFAAKTLMWLAPDAHRVGSGPEDQWRITRTWLYNPGGWTNQCQVPNAGAAQHAKTTPPKTTDAEGRQVNLYVPANMELLAEFDAWKEEPVEDDE